MKSNTFKKPISHISKTIYVCLAEFLEQTSERYFELIESERTNLTKESVHDIRVTIRKLEACFDLLETLGIRQKNLTKDLLHIRKLHGPLRNIHVEMDIIKETRDKIKLKLFRSFLLKREQKFENKIVKELKHVDLENHQNEIKKLVNKLLQKDTPAKNEKALNDMVIQNQKITKEYEKTKKGYSANSLKSIHAIRVTAKRLRYQSEILKPVISFDNTKLRQLKHYQEIFGNIQNNYVLQISIDKYLDKHSKKGSKSVLALQTYIAKKQNVLLANVGKIKGIAINKAKKSE